MARGVIVPHYIRENKRRALPRRLLFFDSETDVRTGEGLAFHTAFLVVTIYATRSRSGDWMERERRIFTSSREFIRYVKSLLRPREVLYVFAHNAEFDLLATGLLWHFLSRVGVSEMPVSDLARFFWRARTKLGTAYFIDTRNYFDCSLEELGKWIGLEKLKMPERDAPLEEWVKYCERDTEIIFRAVVRLLRLIRDEDLGNFAPTLSSLAFNIYRHRFMPPRTILSHQRRSVTQFEREAYFGGRAEAWYRGYIRGPVFYLDFISMYASVMKDLDAPVKFLRYLWGVDPDQLPGIMQHWAVIADVEIEVEQPIAPLRAKDMVCFPVGRFRTVLCGPELELVMRKGKIHKVHRVAIYRKARIFREFVEYCWAKRREALEAGDTLAAKIWKRVMNSLYGKFGQYGYEQRVEEVETGVRDFAHYHYKIMDTGERGDVFLFPNRRITVRQSLLGPNSVVAISAYITSAARVKLWETMEAIGMEHIYYVDTDGFIVDYEGRKRADPLIGEELGMLREKWAGIDLYIYSGKHFIADAYRALAGIPSRVIEIRDNKIRVATMIHWKHALDQLIFGAATFAEGVKTVNPPLKNRKPTPSGRTLPLRAEDVEPVSARSPILGPVLSRGRPHKS